LHYLLGGDAGVDDGMLGKPCPGIHHSNTVTTT
jgi:hypothetical protein